VRLDDDLAVDLLEASNRKRKLFAVVPLDVDVAANPLAAGDLEQKVACRGFGVVVARERDITREAVFTRRTDDHRLVATRQRVRTIGILRHEARRLGVLAILAVLAV